MNPATAKATMLEVHDLADDNLATLTEVAAILAEKGFKPIVIIAQRIGCPHELEFHNVEQLDDMEMEELARDLFLAVGNTRGSC